MKRSLPFFLVLIVLLLASFQIFAETPYRAYVVRAGSGQIDVFKTTESGQYLQAETIYMPGGVQPTGIAVTPDGVTAYIASENYRTYVYNLYARAFVEEIFVGYDRQTAVAVSPDGRYVYVAVRNNFVAKIETASNTVRSRTFWPYEFNELSLSADGSRIYLTGMYPDQFIRETDTGNFNTLHAIMMPFYAYQVAVAPDGRRVYATNYLDGKVTVTDLTSFAQSVVPVGSRPTALAIAPDGSRVYVANTDSGTVSVIDAVTNQVTATIPVGDDPFGLAVSPDGARVYVGRTGCEAGGTIIDTATDTPTAVPVMGCGTKKIVFAPRELTPGALLFGLIDMVRQMNLAQGISNSFDSKLQSAVQALDAERANQRETAINLLDAFIQHAYAQYGKGLTYYQSTTLATRAEQIKMQILAAP